MMIYYALLTSVVVSFLTETVEPVADLSEVLLPLRMTEDLLELLGAEAASFST